MTEADGEATAGALGEARCPPTIIPAPNVEVEMLRLVSAGEVADKRAPPDCCLLRQPISELFKLPNGQAEARHPGIDMQHRRQPSVLPRDLCPVGDLAGFVEDRNELMEDELLCRPRQGSVQNRYLARRWKRTAQCDCLVERGDKKEPASRSGKNGGHLRRTQAVRIRLDDRRASPAHLGRGKPGHDGALLAD